MEKIQFPFFLDSYKDIEPTMDEQLIFHNYYPRSEQLKSNAKIIPISMNTAQIQKNILLRMNNCRVDRLYEDGKINIYPKKNTIDINKHLNKKMKKIEKKNQKAIIYIAKELLNHNKNNISTTKQN